jgi:hypothetical protein
LKIIFRQDYFCVDEFLFDKTESFPHLTSSFETREKSMHNKSYFYDKVDKLILHPLEQVRIAEIKPSRVDQLIKNMANQNIILTEELIIDSKKLYQHMLYAYAVGARVKIHEIRADYSVEEEIELKKLGKEIKKITFEELCVKLFKTTKKPKLENENLYDSLSQSDQFQKVNSVNLYLKHIVESLLLGECEGPCSFEGRWQIDAIFAWSFSELTNSELPAKKDEKFEFAKKYVTKHHFDISLFHNLKLVFSPKAKTS